MKLVGTISDGDIRRALIDGYNFETPIKKILKKSNKCKHQRHRKNNT